MSLNKSTGNMYEFVTHTWNTIKGKCPHACSYCYMKRWGEQPELHFDEKELRTGLGSDNFIFVGSSCDMFAKDILDEWIEKTLFHCLLNTKNKYLFQSKDVWRIYHFSELLPIISKVCTTIETNKYIPEFMGNTPHPRERATYLQLFSERFVTIEPIMDFDIDEFIKIIKICDPEQVNIGADTGNNHLPEPSAEKIKALIDQLSTFTKVVQKKNLSRLVGNTCRRSHVY